MLVGLALVYFAADSEAGLDAPRLICKVFSGILEIDYRNARGTDAVRAWNF